jgi:hypothetical protein
METLFIVGIIWATLIVGCWGFWFWYSKGELRSVSPLSVLTLPARSVWLVWVAIRGYQQCRRQQKKDLDRSINDRLKMVLSLPWEYEEDRHFLIRTLEDVLQDAPPETAQETISEIQETIKTLKEKE